MMTKYQVSLLIGTIAIVGGVLKGPSGGALILFGIAIFSGLACLVDY